MAADEQKPLPTEPRRFPWGAWVLVFVVTVGPWCLVQWSLSGSRAARPPATESPSLVGRVAAYLFSGTWHANLLGGVCVFGGIVAMVGVQELVYMVRVAVWDRIQGETWLFVGCSPGSTEFRIDGIDVWQHKWQPLKLRPVVVHDPLHEFRRARVYEIVADGKRVTFAAEECSACAWGFWQARARPA